MHFQGFMHALVPMVLQVHSFFYSVVFYKYDLRDLVGGGGG